MAFYLNPPPRNPLTAFLAAVAGAVFLVGAFFLGAIFLAIGLGVGLLLWVVIAVRIKWLQRKMRKQGVESPFSEPARPQTGDTTIEAEYVVVSREDEQN